jgi:hypothetical protein
MLKKIYIILICLICFFVVLNAVSLFFDVKYLFHYVDIAFNHPDQFQTSNLSDIIIQQTTNSLKDLIQIFICISIVLFAIFSKTNAQNIVKYTYEEYKAEKDRKKTLNQEKQKLKLKQKLNELEKGE